MKFKDFYSLFSAELWAKMQGSPDKIAKELNNFPHHKTVLEIGTAEGYIIRQLVIKGVVASAAGYDISEKRLNKARARAKKEGLTKKIKFYLGDGIHLPFKNKTFDVVLLPHILEHIPTRQQVIELLKESARVSRYGLLVSMPLTDADPGLSRYLDPDHIRGQIKYRNGWIYKAKNVEHLFREMGFQFKRSKDSKEFYILKQGSGA